MHCIIPNSLQTVIKAKIFLFNLLISLIFKKNDIFENHFVLKQLNSNSIIETAKIFKSSYPIKMTYLSFIQNYAYIYPISCEEVRSEADAKQETQSLLNYHKISPETYRLGLTKVLFKADVIDQLDEKRELKRVKYLAMFQAQIKCYLLIKNFKLMIQKKQIGNLIRRNIRKYLELKRWRWWKLMKYVDLLKEIKERVSFKQTLI